VTGDRPEWPVLPDYTTVSTTEPVVIEIPFPQARPPGFESCDVYWGSHGCHQPRGHQGDCECDCCECGEHHPHPHWPDTSLLCVARAPYYGPDTRFYGDDVKARGLPELDDA
jgi:hypothetical protein